MFSLAASSTVGNLMHNCWDCRWSAESHRRACGGIAGGHALSIPVVAGEDVATYGIVKASDAELGLDTASLALVAKANSLRMDSTVLPIPP